MEKFKSGDCVYIVDAFNKIKFCQVLKEIKHVPKGVVAYEVQDLIDWKYIVVEHKYCSEKKQLLKGIKRKLK